MATSSELDSVSGRFRRMLSFVGDEVDIGMRRVRKVLSKHEDTPVQTDVKKDQYYTEWRHNKRTLIGIDKDDGSIDGLNYDRHNFAPNVKMELKGSLNTRDEYFKPVIYQTDFQKWRSALRHIIEMYYSDQDFKFALHFLCDTFSRTIAIKETNPQAEHEAPLSESMIPNLLSTKIAIWTDLWTGLRCTYVGPDSVQDIKLCIVTVPRTVSIYVLRGFLVILKALVGLHINSVKFILSLVSQDVRELMNVLRSLEDGNVPIEQLDNLWDLNETMFVNCGIKQHRQKNGSHYTFHPSNENIAYLVNLYSILYIFDPAV